MATGESINKVQKKNEKQNKNKDTRAKAETYTAPRAALMSVLYERVLQQHMSVPAKRNRGREKCSNPV